MGRVARCSYTDKQYFQICKECNFFFTILRSYITVYHQALAFLKTFHHAIAVGFVIPPIQFSSFFLMDLKWLANISVWYPMCYQGKHSLLWNARDYASNPVLG